MSSNLSSQISTTNLSASKSQTTLTKKQQVFAAAILGFVIVTAVGLLPMDVVHNAAHDLRHSAAFPCH